MLYKSKYRIELNRLDLKIGITQFLSGIMLRYAQRILNAGLAKLEKGK